MQGGGILMVELLWLLLGLSQMMRRVESHAVTLKTERRRWRCSRTRCFSTSCSSRWQLGQQMTGAGPAFYPHWRHLIYTLELQLSWAMDREWTQPESKTSAITGHSDMKGLSNNRQDVSLFFRSHQLALHFHLQSLLWLCEFVDTSVCSVFLPSEHRSL